MDGFIDDIIDITLDYPNWADRTKNAALSVIHTIFRPLQSSEPLKWDDPFHFARYQEKFNLPNTINAWFRASKPDI